MSWKGFKKAVERLPHNTKAKFGFSKEARDEEFDLHDGRLKTVENETEAFLGQSKQISTSYSAMLTHQASVSIIISQLYETLGEYDKVTSDATKKANVVKYMDLCSEIQIELKENINTLNDRVINPLSELLSILKSIRKLIAKRNHKLTDLTRHTESLDKYRNKPSLDVAGEKSLYKYETLVQQAEDDFNLLNDLLKKELPTLWELREQWAIPCFLALYQCQIAFHNSYATFMQRNSELQGLLLTSPVIPEFDNYLPQFEHLFEKIDWFSATPRNSNLSSLRTKLTLSHDSDSLHVPVADEFKGHQRSVSNPPAYNTAVLNKPSSPRVVDKKPPPLPRLLKARALYDFEAQAEGDLTLKEGDIVEIVKRSNDENDWWTGRVKGKIGLFPANYVELL